jgi:hypothetical protein
MPIPGGVKLAVVAVAVATVVTPLRIWMGIPSQPGTGHQPSRPLRRLSNRSQLCPPPKLWGRPAKPPCHPPSAWPRFGWQSAAVNSTAAAMLPRALAIPGRAPFRLPVAWTTPFALHQLRIRRARPFSVTLLERGRPANEAPFLTQSCSGARSTNSWLTPDQSPLTEPSMGATQGPGDVHDRWSATVAPCSR